MTFLCSDARIRDDQLSLSLSHSHKHTPPHTYMHTHTINTYITHTRNITQRDYNTFPHIHSIYLSHTKTLTLCPTFSRHLSPTSASIFNLSIIQTHTSAHPISHKLSLSFYNTRGYVSSLSLLLYVTCSLNLSYAHTRTLSTYLLHKHKHTISLTITHSRTLTLYRSIYHSSSLLHIQILSDSVSHTHFHYWSITYTHILHLLHARTYTITYTVSYWFYHTHRHALSFTLSYSHFPSLSLAFKKTQNYLYFYPHKVCSGLYIKKKFSAFSINIFLLLCVRQEKKVQELKNYYFQRQNFISGKQIYAMTVQGEQNENKAPISKGGEF